MPVLDFGEGRLVDTVIVILKITLVLTPIPLSNVVPALLSALVSLAYLEEDGIPLSIGLLATSDLCSP